MKHKSKGAERVYRALSLLGNYTILPEHPVGDNLLLDYYVKELRLGLECDGIQHAEFNAFFFDSKDAFRDAQRRDARKDELCEQQGIKLIRLPYPTIMAAPSPQALLEIILQEISAADGETKETDW